MFKYRIHVAPHPNTFLWLSLLEDLGLETRYQIVYPGWNNQPHSNVFVVEYNIICQESEMLIITLKAPTLFDVVEKQHA